MSLYTKLSKSSSTCNKNYMWTSTTVQFFVSYMVDLHVKLCAMNIFTLNRDTSRNHTHTHRYIYISMIKLIIVNQHLFLKYSTFAPENHEQKENADRVSTFFNSSDYLREKLQYDRHCHLSADGKNIKYGKRYILNWSFFWMELRENIGLFSLILPIWIS